MDETTIHELAGAIAEAWDDDDTLEQVHRAHLYSGADYPEHEASLVVTMFLGHEEAPPALPAGRRCSRCSVGVQLVGMLIPR